MKIGIIGAGLAGLNAAQRLKQMGHQVLVVEKSRGKGGRLANKRLSWGVLDIGAQYFTARSESFKQAVQHWEAKGIVSQWSFTPYRTLLEGLTLSPDDTTRYTGQPVMNSLAHFLAADLDIHFQTQISQLQNRQGLWTLITDDGHELSGFDWVLVTSPAEQSKALLTDVSDLTEQIPDAVHSPCWALGLATTGEVPENIQGVFGDRIVSWVSRQSSKPGQQRTAEGYDRWVLHFSPQWSLQHGKETKRDIVALGLQWLQSAVQVPLTPHYHYKHFWRYANLQYTPGEKPYLVDRSQKLAVMGSWCCGGRVEGAYNSSTQLINDLFS